MSLLFNSNRSSESWTIPSRPPPHTRTQTQAYEVNKLEPLITSPSRVSLGSRGDEILSSNIPLHHHLTLHWPSPAMKYKLAEVTVIDLCRKTPSVMHAQTSSAHTPTAGCVQWSHAGLCRVCLWLFLDVFDILWRVDPSKWQYLRCGTCVSNIAEDYWEKSQKMHFFSLKSSSEAFTSVIYMDKSLCGHISE